MTCARAEIDGTPVPLTERDVSVTNGICRLHGTLTRPGRGNSDLAALILNGSGPVDRDGNVPDRHDYNVKRFAHALAAAGIVSLRVDKRGIGKSRAVGTREEDLRLGDYVSDAICWIDLLRAQPGVRSAALLGHSEGALVGTLAAQRTCVRRLVTIAGLGYPADAAIDRQLSAMRMPARLRKTAKQIIAKLQRGERVRDVPAELAPLLRRSVQGYLISWFQYDPAIELARVDAPVLVVHGARDSLVPLDNVLRLCALRPDAQLALIPTMDHHLMYAPTGDSKQARDGRKRVFADALPSRISAFLSEG